MDIVIGGVYRHYKGNLYRVLSIAKHSETLEDMVVYVNVEHPDSVWVRPKQMWNEVVQTPKGEVLRFTLEK